MSNLCKMLGANFRPAFLSAQLKFWQCGVRLQCGLNEPIQCKLLLPAGECACPHFAEPIRITEQREQLFGEIRHVISAKEQAGGAVFDKFRRAACRRCYQRQPVDERLANPKAAWLRVNSALQPEMVLLMLLPQPRIETF